jgi:hypothetical protein
MGVIQYLNVALCNTKVDKSSSIAISSFGLPYSYWGYANCHGCTRVKFRGYVLHGPKNNQILCNTFMGVLGLKIRLMEYVLSYPKGIV